jgi:hypothetical protein
MSLREKDEKKMIFDWFTRTNLDSFLSITLHLTPLAVPASCTYVVDCLSVHY